MKLVIWWRILLEELISFLKLSKTADGTKVISSVPLVFVDQLQSPDTKKIEKWYGRINDKEAAKRFGAASMEEYSHWAWRSCGIACVAEALYGLKVYDGKLMDLVREGLEMDGYITRNDLGWKHEALAQLARNYGLKAYRKRCGLMTVLNEVSKGKYVIISINTPSGGHLVGVKGFAWRGKLTKVLVDDPFVYKYKKGKDTVYLLDNLKSVYKRNAIIIGE